MLSKVAGLYVALRRPNLRAEAHAQRLQTPHGLSRDLTDEALKRIVGGVAHSPALLKERELRPTVKTWERCPPFRRGARKRKGLAQLGASRRSDPIQSGTQHVATIFQA